MFVIEDDEDGPIFVALGDEDAYPSPELSLNREAIGGSILSSIVRSASSVRRWSSRRAGPDRPGVEHRGPPEPVHPDRVREGVCFRPGLAGWGNTLIEDRYRFSAPGGAGMGTCIFITKGG